MCSPVCDNGTYKDVTAALDLGVDAKYPATAYLGRYLALFLGCDGT